MTAPDTNAPLPESAQRVADHLRTLGYEKAIVMLPATAPLSAIINEAVLMTLLARLFIVAILVLPRAENCVNGG